MKNKWSKSWIRSKQPRKQRKYRYNAPAHVRHKMVSANLSKELRQKFGLRSMPLRKGDEVQVMRGSLKGHKGIVEEVDLKKLKIIVSGAKVKKVDGSEVAKAMEPSNLKILNLKLDDKRRQEVVGRAKKGKLPTILTQPAAVKQTNADTKAVGSNISAQNPPIQQKTEDLTNKTVKTKE